MLSAEEILKRYWGYNSFRPLQKEIIDNILSGRDTLALLPTGGGKSVCYQLPALMSKGVCIVISPLIALMKDQVDKLKELEIPAACIHSGMHYADVKRTLDNTVQDGYKLLYISPERLQTDFFNEYLPNIDISFIAVDEAHCVSQWGHDFRPDYLKIASLREVFRDVPMLALTASATVDVQKDIITQLQLRKPGLFLESFSRKNIFFSVQYSENKNRDVIQALADNKGCSIIYCRSRKQTETLVRYLSQNGISASHYHAGMQKDKREATQQSWMNNETNTIIATTAFGMGIDKADVRMVIHYDAPEHLEAYYQEAGRAGRDGKNALALLLYNQTDINRLEESIALQFPPEEYLRKVYQSVAEYLQIAIGMEPDRYYPFDLYDFCKKFDLQAVPAARALKLLEQDGLWTLSEAVFNPATIEFKVDRETLDRLSDTYPDLGFVTTNLLRLYGTIFHYPTTIRLSLIAKQLKMNQELAEGLLQKLADMGILEYRKPSDTPQLYFHHYRVDSRHLIINTKRIETLRKKHIERTHAMTAFIENKEQCRERILLSYFGEQADINCGHCDVCIANRKKQPADIKNLRKEIQQLLKEQSTVGIQQLISLFPGTIREDIGALIRLMADEGIIKLNTNNTISLK